MKLPENNTEDVRAATSQACPQLTIESQLFVSWYEEYLRCVLGLADETGRRYLAIAARFFIEICAEGTPDWNRFDGEHTSLPAQLKRWV
jgi:hypothetical protein